MFHFKNEKVYSPVNGTLESLDHVEDEMFKKELLGMTIPVTAQDDILYAPIDGVVSALYPSAHAVGITRKDGLQILLHIGIDTCKLQGKGFTALVAQGDHVRCHQKLILFDQSYLRSCGYATQIFIIFTNHTQFHIKRNGKQEQIMVKDVLTNAGKAEN